MEQEEQKTPKPRGGFREGAGRKPKDGQPTMMVSAKLRKDYVLVIDKCFGNRSEFIQKAVKEKLRREGAI